MSQKRKPTINTLLRERNKTTTDSNAKFVHSSSDKWKFSLHKYPAELEGSPELSHYVMFYIAVPSKSKHPHMAQSESNDFRSRIQDYLYDENGKMRGGRGGRINAEYNAVTSGMNTLTGGALGDFRDAAKKRSQEKTTGDKHKSSTGRAEAVKQGATMLSNIISLGSPATMMFATEAICMYIPEALSTSYDVDWQAEEMRGSSMLLQTARNAIQTMNADNNKDVIEGLGKTFGTAMGAMASSAINFIGGDIISAGTKQIMNPYMEMLFKGVKNRSFEMAFKFTPKSTKEAQQVHDIIQTFKKYALPEVPSEESEFAQSFFIYPAEWDIVFYTVDNEQAVRNKFLARYGRSVLTGISVDFGSAGTTAFLRPDEELGTTGAPPVQTSLTLSFTEIDLITSDMVDQGF